MLQSTDSLDNILYYKLWYKPFVNNRRMCNLLSKCIPKEYAHRYAKNSWENYQKLQQLVFSNTDEVIAGVEKHLNETQLKLIIAKE